MRTGAEYVTGRIGGTIEMCWTGVSASRKNIYCMNTGLSMQNCTYKGRSWFGGRAWSTCDPRELENSVSKDSDNHSMRDDLPIYPHIFDAHSATYSLTNSSLSLTRIAVSVYPRSGSTLAQRQHGALKVCVCLCESNWSGVSRLPIVWRHVTGLDSTVSISKPHSKHLP